MKIRFSIILLLIPTLCFSQLKGVIINSQSKDKVPYVNIWVENENIGTTSNEKGEFELKVHSPQPIIISAIGYETKKISSDSINGIIELKPLPFELTEVVILPNKSNQEFVIGQFKRSQIGIYFAVETIPWITARYFGYKEEYENTPYLKKIRLLTQSKIKNAKFNIRLYSVDKDGKPDAYIYDNIIGIAKKGKKITEIDLSDFNITFPKEGFFIAVEWFIIETNKYEFTYFMENSKKKYKGISYEPMFGMLPSDSNENSWTFEKGKWEKAWKNTSEDVRSSYKDKYNLMAVELTLTN